MCLKVSSCIFHLIVLFTDLTWACGESRERERERERERKRKEAQNTHHSLAKPHINK